MARPRMAPNLEMSVEEYEYLLTEAIIPQMMFVSGETAEPSTETTTIIEEIVHTQVVEMVCHIHLSTAIIGS